MGRFIYNAGDVSFPIDDRPLAHLRLVIMTKLRRGEPFMMQVPDPAGIGTRSLWINPSVPVTFSFSGSRAPGLDMQWIDELMNEASSSNGLTFSPEPKYLRAEGAGTPARHGESART